MARIGKYEILGHVGVGGLGEVFRVRPADRKPAPILALKRLRDQWHKRTDVAQLFAAEADIGLKLSHPNVVQIYEIGFDEQGRLFLVMEYVAGKSLGALIERVGPDQLMAYEIALHIVRCVLAGLHSAHELRSAGGVPLNLVHRDVTPDNVFISYRGAVKLSDFGVAHIEALEGSAENRGTFGKLPYMSPEQLRQGSIDRRSDIYSCGVILYQLLCGAHPFLYDDENDDAVLIERIIRGKHKPVRKHLPAVPEALDAVVEQALSVDAAKRFATAAQMESALLPFYRARASWSPIIAGMMRQLFSSDFAKQESY